MTVSVSSQMILFLLSLSIGVAFGLLYDLLSLVRLLCFKGKIFTLVWDCLYLLLCGVLTFFLILAGNAGEIRLFVLEGELLGFLLYRFTIGRFISTAVKRIVKKTRHTAASAGRKIQEPVRSICERMGKNISGNKERMKKTMPKIQKVTKMRLKPVHNLMYNIFYRVRHKVAENTVHAKSFQKDAGRRQKNGEKT